MAGPPSHPDTGITGQDSGAPPTARPRWKTAVIVAIAIAVLAVMVILHLTGTLGAGTHG
jgi:antibiotic biosynthesis monooxygenase (ABM) superfamily enzyme